MTQYGTIFQILICVGVLTIITAVLFELYNYKKHSQKTSKKHPSAEEVKTSLKRAIKKIDELDS